MYSYFLNCLQSKFLFGLFLKSKFKTISCSFPPLTPNPNCWFVGESESVSYGTMMFFFPVLFMFFSTLRSYCIYDWIFLLIHLKWWQTISHHIGSFQKGFIHKITMTPTVFQEKKSILCLLVNVWIIKWMIFLFIFFFLV